MKDKEYEKTVCPQCDGSGYVHAYQDGRVVASCCDDIQFENKGEKLKEKIAFVITKHNLEHGTCCGCTSSDYAERIMQEIEK